MLKLMTLIALVVAAAIAATAYAVSFSSFTDRPDCPGKIVCPLTGDLVCKDRCPVDNKTATEETPSCCFATTKTSRDSSRPDCPGRIVCPLTGKLVCKDRCPLGANEKNAEQSTNPNCCL